MASSLLVSRLANEISSILIGKRLCRGRWVYSRHTRAPRAALGLQGLSGPRPPGQQRRRSRRQQPLLRGANALSAPTTPAFGILSCTRGCLTAKPSQRLTQPFWPLPLADGLGPPPHFRPVLRLRTGSARRLGFGSGADSGPAPLWVCESRWGQLSCLSLSLSLSS